MDVVGLCSGCWVARRSYYMVVRSYWGELVVVVFLGKMACDVISVVMEVAAILFSVLVAPCMEVRLPCTAAVAGSWLCFVCILVVAEAGLACTCLLLVCTFCR